MIDIFNSAMINRIKSTFNKTVIVTDDGHGWFTKGKQSLTDQPFYENEFNSILEAKFMFLLDMCRIEHYQLSPGSIDTELLDRSKVEHDIFNKAKTDGKRVVGISFHCDAFELKDKPGKQNDANGFSVYFYHDEKTGKISTSGRLFARVVADSIISSDKINRHVITPRHDKGIVGNNFYILRETKGVWILIENAFMTNDNDLNWLKNDDFRNDRVLAIFEGLYNYVSNF